MARKVKALRRITDGGHNIRKGATETVADGYAKEWIGRGWAEAVKDTPVREPKVKPE